MWFGYITGKNPSRDVYVFGESKWILIWLFLAHCYMQMWPTDLHTCFACIIPTVAWHFHSCSYALDCTFKLCRIRLRNFSRRTWINTILAQIWAENCSEHMRRVQCCALRRHFEGLLGCCLLFLTYRKHTGNFYRSTVICKQVHSFPVSLTRFLKQHTRKHTYAHDD